MKNLLKLEGFLLFGLVLFLFSKLDCGWGASRYALLFFAPDLPAKNAGTGMSMLGYLANPRLGAWTLRLTQDNAYNLIHHNGLSVAIYALGALLFIPC